MGRITFEEYKEKIESLPKEERLKTIFADVKCNFPIFYGRVSQGKPKELGNGHCDWFITDIHCIDNNNLYYPYDWIETQPYGKLFTSKSVNRIYFTSGNEKNIENDEKVFFSVRVGRMKQQNELFQAEKIRRVSDVLGKTDYTAAEDFNLESFTAIISAFKSTGIEEIDKIFAYIDDYKNTVDELVQSMTKISPSIDKLNEMLNRIEDPKPQELEKLAEYSLNISKVLDRLKDERLPDDEEFEKQNQQWTSLNEKVKNTLAEIAESKEELSTVITKFGRAYPEAKYLIVPSDKRELSLSELETIGKRLEYNYSKDKIRLFLAALNTTQIVALCGRPGTGKTTFAEQMAQALGACFHLVEVQNNWTDSTDLLGFYNPTNQTYQSTPFLEALLAAKADWERNGNNARLHIICLDEMNLSRVEYYFATFLSLLQRPEGKRMITLLPNDADPSIIKEGEDEKIPAWQEKLFRYARFELPSNVRFVGTMNMDDTAQFLSPKVVDRAIFIEFDGKIVPEENDNCLSEALYFPWTDFSKPKAAPEEVSACIKKLNTFSIIAPRMENYIRTMWPVYKVLSEDESKSLAEFTDMILLSKILPSTVHKFKDESGNDIEIADDLAMSKIRYKDGITRGNAIHHYDTEIWSYWE